MLIKYAFISLLSLSTSYLSASNEYRVLIQYPEFELREYAPRSEVELTAAGSFEHAVRQGLHIFERFYGKDLAYSPSTVFAKQLEDSDYYSTWRLVFPIPFSTLSSIGRNIKVINKDKTYVAALTLLNAQSDSKINEKADFLLNLLQQHHIKPIERPFYAKYGSLYSLYPYQPCEVLVLVDAVIHIDDLKNDSDKQAANHD